MTDALVPPSVAAIRWPWCLTDSDRRRAEIGRLDPSTDQVDAALDALESCLAFLAEDHTDLEEAEAVLPEGFLIGWFVYRLRLAELMPTLRDARLATVRRWLTEHIDPGHFGMQWTAPPPDYVEMVGRFWAVGTVGSIMFDLVDWLHPAVQAPSQEGAKARLLTMLAAYAPRVHWHTGRGLVQGIAMVGGGEAVPLLTRIEQDPTIHARVRDEARHYREWPWKGGPFPR